MRKILLMVALSVSPAALPVMANAHGCMKGAVVGGVVGHVAGHHGVVGAVAGCAVGHHEAKVKERQAAQARAAPQATAQSGQTQPSARVRE
jgi:hypothetical protein